MSQPQTAEEIDAELAKLIVLHERLEKAPATAFLEFSPLPYQGPWYDAWTESKAHTIVLCAGNQVGKTLFGTIVAVSEATGVRPFKLGGIAPPKGQWPSMNCKGKRIAIFGETMKTSVQNNIMPKLEQFVDDSMLRKKKINSQTGAIERIWWKSGCEMVVGSYDQDTSMHEGGVWDLVWFDEPPPQKLYSAMERGTMARKGKIIITATPLKEAWMLDTLILPAKDPNSDTFGRVIAFEAEIWDNAKSRGGVLEDEEIKAFLAKLPEAEREAREHGRFTHLVGIEFREFNPRVHIVPDLYS